jgi:hypothetical protein
MSDGGRQPHSWRCFRTQSHSNRYTSSSDNTSQILPRIVLVVLNRLSWSFSYRAKHVFTTLSTSETNLQPHHLTFMPPLPFSFLPLSHAFPLFDFCSF